VSNASPAPSERTVEVTSEKESALEGSLVIPIIEPVTNRSFANAKTKTQQGKNTAATSAIKARTIRSTNVSTNKQTEGKLPKVKILIQAP
jgi:hypothetical protein